MREKVARLLEATMALVSYLEENQVYDKLADCGCGYLDSYRTEGFEALIHAVRAAAAEVGEELAASA
jgi:hypothetical protein